MFLCFSLVTRYRTKKLMQVCPQYELILKRLKHTTNVTGKILIDNFRFLEETHTLRSFSFHLKFLQFNVYLIKTVMQFFLSSPFQLLDLFPVSWKSFTYRFSCQNCLLKKFENAETQLQFRNQLQSRKNVPFDVLQFQVQIYF